MQLPREPANLQMDLQMVVETFVVVVMGGLGSIAGAFFASVLIGLVHAFGIHFFPQATLVLIFLTMALVLAVRPQGLMGELPGAAQREKVPTFDVGASTKLLQWGLAVLLLLMAMGAIASGEYAQSVMEDVLIAMLFGLSLQAMMALSGWVSFGHAAYFGLGAYAAALGHLHWGLSSLSAAMLGVITALLAAILMASLLRRSTGVYLAMLSLAFAQMVWASASQWVSLTGGDNGLIGLMLIAPESRAVFDAALLAGVLAAVAMLGRWSVSSRGAALQALRDAPLRAAASGLPVNRLRYQVFVLSAALAGLAGGLWAAIKGAVFPSVASVGTSVDALLVILLGGVHQLWGALVGSALLVWGGAELGQGLDYWRGVLGLLIMAVMVLSPSGVLGGLQSWWLSRRRPA